VLNGGLTDCRADPLAQLRRQFKVATRKQNAEFLAAQACCQALVRQCCLCDQGRDLFQTLIPCGMAIVCGARPRCAKRFSMAFRAISSILGFWQGLVSIAALDFRDYRRCPRHGGVHVRDLFIIMRPLADRRAADERQTQTKTVRSSLVI